MTSSAAYVAFADPPYENCSKSSHVNDSSFETTLISLLSFFSANSSIQKSYYTSYGSGPSRVYGMYMCLDYVSNESCQKCITTASEDICILCPHAKEAIVWEEVCQLRYSNNNFMGMLDVTGNLGLCNEQNLTEPEKFQSAVNQILRSLTEVVSLNVSANKHATGEVPFEDKAIYALVQCSTDLSVNDCRKCLQSAIKDIPDCCYASIGARVLGRSCYLRYEFYPFYLGETGTRGSTTGNNEGTSKNGKGNNPIKRQNFGKQGETSFDHQKFRGRGDKLSGDFSCIDLGSLRVATKNFSDLNKLGQGGFGPVYKAWHLWNERKGLELKDPLLSGSCPEDQFLTYMNIGLLCVQEDAYDRPTMSSVILMLKNDQSITLGQPEQPPFSAGRFSANNDHDKPYGEDCSVNFLTMSEILPQ
ncbi:hypothetical protein VNO77_41738 [Canavalia gladiata]|uniref:Gnk2-homologous domain-containing protein n=1 Tax=Canavalia gladiata TaxID=3824 RepID=A0AAN9K180_CANGL